MNVYNNLAITATRGLMNSAIGNIISTLHGLAANGGRDTNCKFYYSSGGGSILHVATRSITGGLVPPLKEIGINAYNSLYNKKKPIVADTRWIDSELEKQNTESKLYGKMEVKGGVIYALDDWGEICPDALMLGIETGQKINVSQDMRGASIGADGKNQPSKKAVVTNKLTTSTLVWYDTTAMITINSDKNLIATRVQGRDYSRKELISNGDIKFSVSGQITSGRPDLYPAEEVQKFIKVMQYKGIVRINNQMLDQFGISHIVIDNFSITPKQGYKAVQNYTFSAIGLQPEKENVITNDTVKLIAPKNIDTISDKTPKEEWVDMLKSQLDGLKTVSSDILEKGFIYANGLWENIM